MQQEAECSSRHEQRPVPGPTGPLKVVVAMDSFKGAVSSRKAGEAVRAGVLAAEPDADVHLHEVADGGEGLLEALAGALPHCLVDLDVLDAIGEPMISRSLVLGDDTVAVESASTVGLARMARLGLVGPDLPTRTSTAGLGLEIQRALTPKTRRLVVGLGGTVTTDGGLGLLLQLGARAWDQAGNQIFAEPGVNPLLRGPRRIELPEQALQGVEIIGLTDVTSPLLGENGAAQVFGPQKGATAEMVLTLEREMGAFATALEAVGADVAGVPGAGAAGGLGAALLALGGHLENGLMYVASAVGLVDSLVSAHLVITGEGSFDGQSALGKVPFGVAKLARDAGAHRVVALAGRVQLSADPADLDPFDAVLPIHGEPMSLEQAMRPDVTVAGLTRTACSLTRLVSR